MLVEDLTVFFADFGVAATLNGAAVTVIFDAPVAQQFTDPGLYAPSPSVRIATASVPASPEGKALVVNGTSYTVREHVADGTGMSVLMLSRA